MKFEIGKSLLTFAVGLAAATAMGQGLLGRGGARPAGANPLLRARNTLAAAGAAGAGTATASAAEANAGAASDLNFKDAPLDMVLAVYANLVERTVLKDPQTPTPTITLESRPGQKLTKEEQIEALEVVLEMNGVHFEPYGEKFVRALPRKSVRKEGIPLYMNPEEKFDDSGRVISVWMQFRNIATDEAQKALEGFKSDSGLLQVFERTNSILVTDTQHNINRMLEVQKAIDVATPVLENVYVRQIKSASAEEIKTALEAIVQESQKELEKNGKAPQNSPSANVGRPGPSLLRRPGAPQPEAPKSVESLVTSVSDADRGLIRGKVMILADERSNKLIIVTMKSNMDFFDKVIEQLDVETTPDVEVEVIRLKYANAEDVSDMINDLIGNSIGSKNDSKNTKNPTSRTGSQGGNLTRGTTSAAKSSANQRSGESKAGELSKDNVTVLADKRINGLVVMARKEDMPTLHQIIESMDVKLSQVLIETVIIEVTLGDGLDVGVDWISRGKAHGANGVQMTDSLGNKQFYLLDPEGKVTPYHGSAEQSDAYSSSGFTLSDIPVLSSASRVVRDGFVTAAGGSESFALGGGGFGGTTAMSAMSNIATNFLSKGINAIFKSDKLNLGAIIQASKTDSRTKYLASPVIMTVDNKEASVEATEMRYLFKGYATTSSYYGTAQKDYEQKEVGTTIKVTPKINPNGTVMLTIETNYSIINPNAQEVDGVMQDTTTTRKMTADVLMENNQTVVLGGLTETSKGESETGIPFLKDIPWIGKWLFSHTTVTEARKELLIFMTPYVLDDGEAAQAEALRRKRALSDARPWEDHSWSKSALADPVDKKERMRRLKEEAKKQDEDRQTKLAIEKWKLDRAKALEKMDKAEREFWFEQHKEELEKEEKKRFEKLVEEQEDLQALAASIRSNRLEKAEAKIEEANAAERAAAEESR